MTLNRWISGSACKCLFFLDLCAGINTHCFILKINQMLCCCFSVWLHICSVLNLLCHATASSRNRSPAYLPQQVLDWRLARHPDVSIAVPPSWDFITNSPHYTIKKYCIPFCLCHTDSKSSTLCVMNALFQSGLKNSQSGTSATIIVETEGFIWFDSVESLTGVATVISGEVANFFFFFFHLSGKKMTVHEQSVIKVSCSQNSIDWTTFCWKNASHKSRGKSCLPGVMASRFIIPTALKPQIKPQILQGSPIPLPFMKL